MTAALLTSLIAASAWVEIPVGAVPVTLQTFFVVLAALLLSPGWAVASMGVYFLLGAAGLPIFSGAQGGLGIVVGPTGGYLMGFVLGAGLGSLARYSMLRARHSYVADAVAVGVTLVVVYTIGVAQLGIVTGMATPAAILAGFLPFIVVDLMKGAVAIGAATAIRRARRR